MFGVEHLDEVLTVLRCCLKNVSRCVTTNGFAWCHSFLLSTISKMYDIVGARDCVASQTAVHQQLF